MEGPHRPLRNAIRSRQEAACYPTRTMVGMEVHIKVARIREQFRECRRVTPEMAIRDKDPVLPDIDVPVYQVQIRAHGAGEPPNDRTCRCTGGEVMDMSEADALIPLVVQDDDRFDRAVL